MQFGKTVQKPCKANKKWSNPPFYAGFKVCLSLQIWLAPEGKGLSVNRQCEIGRGANAPRPKLLPTKREKGG